MSNMFEGMDNWALNEEIMKVDAHMLSIAVFMQKPETHFKYVSDMNDIFRAYEMKVRSLEGEIQKLKEKIEKAIK